MNKSTSYIIIGILIAVVAFLVYRFTRKQTPVNTAPVAEKLPVNTTMVSDPSNGLDADHKPAQSANMSVPIFNTGIVRNVPAATVPGPSPTPVNVVVVGNTTTPTSTPVSAPLSPTLSPTGGGSDTTQTVPTGNDMVASAGSSPSGSTSTATTSE